MGFIHHNEVIEKFGNNFTGVILVSDVKIKDNFDIYYAENEITETYLNENIKPVSDSWQDIFMQMGAKPKYKSSITSLYDTFISKGALYKINPIVDFYNHYSLKNGYPMAAYNFDKIIGDLELKIVPKGLDFTPLGNPKVVEKTKNNEIVYIDSEKVICRYWNLQDCNQTKIVDDVKNVLFIFDLFCDSKDSAVIEFSKIENDFDNIFKDSISFKGITGPLLGNKLDF